MRKQVSPLAIIIALVILIVIVVALWHFTFGRKTTPGPGIAPATGPYDGTGAPPPPPPPSEGVPPAPA